MKTYRVRDHLKEKLKDPYFKIFYELEFQKYAMIEKIVAYRIKHRLTQRQLAKKVGVAQQQVSTVEDGEFNILVLEKILLAIGMTVQIKAVPFKNGFNSGKKKSRLLAKGIHV